MRKIILYSILFLTGILAYSQHPSTIDPGGDQKQDRTFSMEPEETLPLFKDVPDTLRFSPAYPNPADNEISIDYRIASDAREARFVMYNLLGRTVKDITIEEYIGSLTVNTSGLSEGIYFYSFLINREPVTTHKLVIKH